MRRLLLTALAAGLLAAAVAPAGADPSQRDLVELFSRAANRYIPQEVGKPVDLSYVFGPYAIPPGQDSNRITVDLPVATGYIVAIAPELVSASDGRIPTQQEAHIHHAHWFRVTNDPEQEYYTSVEGQGLSWVFGTGEEKSQGRLDDRARLEPENLDADPTNDFTYGMAVDGTTPQAMIYMIHNKLPAVGNYFVVLDVTFIPGTREEIKAKTGHDIRPLYGQLWGQTKDVVHNSKSIGARWTVKRDATAIAMGGHLHPGGKMVVISNVGPDLDPGDAFNPLCKGIDPDGDGFDGVAILNSYKFDRMMQAWPYTENYQMGTTKYGWRAPVHAGDVLVQQATYAVEAMAQTGLLDTGSRDVFDHNWYEAMSYTGIYMDREQSPGAAPTECTMDALGPDLLGDDTFEAQGLSSAWLDAEGAIKADLVAGVAEVEEDWNHFAPEPGSEYVSAIQGMVNHVWSGPVEPICKQPGLSELQALTVPACGPSDMATQEGPEVTRIVVAGFAYAPGDLNIGTGTPILPKVRQGTTLTFVNADAALNVRHTFTSCAWPCVGTYVSNFPLPTGGPTAFDTGKIGNFDPIDGGLEVAKVIAGEETDTVPAYDMEIDASRFSVGKYTYYCRIHPFMRGGFEVIAA